MPKGNAARPGKQLKALLALAEGKTEAQAAADAGVSTMTLYRWRQAPKFKSDFEELLGNQRERIEARLSVLADKSADVIETALASEAEGLEAAKATLTAYTRITARHDKVLLAAPPPAGPLLAFPWNTKLQLTVESPPALRAEVVTPGDSLLLEPSSTTAREVEVRPEEEGVEDATLSSSLPLGTPSLAVVDGQEEKEGEAE